MSIEQKDMITIQKMQNISYFIIQIMYFLNSNQ